MTVGLTLSLVGTRTQQLNLLSRVHSGRTELDCTELQFRELEFCSPAANQLRDADARDQ